MYLSCKRFYISVEHSNVYEIFKIIIHENVSLTIRKNAVKQADISFICFYYSIISSNSLDMLLLTNYMTYNKIFFKT